MMISSTDVLSFLLSFIIIYFFVKILMRMRHRDIFKERLKDLIHHKERLTQEEDLLEAKAYRGGDELSQSWLQKMVSKIQRSSVEEQEKLKLLFERAGIRSTNARLIYGLSKIIGALLFAVITAFPVFYFIDASFFLKISIVILSSLMGSYGIDFLLRKFVKMRQERIRKAFPEALDLMVICTEAGLSLNATVQRVAREMSQMSPDLGYELALLSIELNMLTDQKKALQNFSNRMDSPYFKTIITNIIQAQQYGTPITQTMRTTAEQFRFDRLIEAEERAAKLPVLMSLPMMGLIFPCIYIVVLGPAMIKVMQSMGGV